MRTLIVVKHKSTAQDLWDSWGPFSQPLLAMDLTSFRTVLSLFGDDPDAIMIATAGLVRQGITVPPDTLVLVGPGINGAELEQIRARARRFQRNSPLDDYMSDWRAARIEAEADSEPEYVPPKVSWRYRIILGVVVSIAVGGVLWIWTPWLRG